MASIVNGIIEQIQAGTTTYAIASTAYGVCASAASDNPKIVEINGFRLVNGVTIHVRFVNNNSYTNTAENPISLRIKYGSGNSDKTDDIPIVQYGTTAIGTTADTNGWRSGSVVSFTYVEIDSTHKYWVRDQGYNSNNTYYYESCYSSTGASTAAKVGQASSYTLPETAGHFAFWLQNTNTAAQKLTLAIKNGSTNGEAKDVWLNGAVTSSNNYNWPSGFYIGYYDGTVYHFRTDGKIPGNISGDAATVNGLTVQTAVPENAVFTDHYAWGDITGKPSTFTPSAHTHYELATMGDNRNDNTTPNTYQHRIIFQGLKYNNKINSPYTDTYSYLVGLRGWGDSSGGNAHEFAFNSKGIYRRQGATDTWGDWFHLLDSSNTTAPSSVPTLSWGNTSTIFTLNGTAVQVTAMDKPTYSFDDLTSHPTTVADYGITDAITKVDGITGSTIKRFGICSVAADQPAKTVSITNGTFSLENGSIVTVYFTHSNTAAQPTLNVNSTGAKSIAASGVQSNGSVKYMLTGVVTFVYYNNLYHVIGYGHTNKTAAENGTDLSLVTTGQKYIWNNKQDALEFDGTYNSSTNKVATQSTVNGLLAAANAMIFKGTIDKTNGNDTTGSPIKTLPNTHEAGWTYRVVGAETYPIVDSNGKYCEIGTLIICIADGETANPADWTAVETNEDGAIIGPASSAPNQIARFDGTSGRIIKTSTATINDDGCLTVTHTAGKSQELRVINSATNPTIDFWMGIGTGNNNYGIYDTKAKNGNNTGKWILTSGDNITDRIWTFNGNVVGNVTGDLTGNASSATKANITSNKFGVAYYSDTAGTFATTGQGTSGYLLQAGGSSNAPSWINATNSNTGSTIVKRDSSGNFSAGTITATLSGNATSASKIAAKLAQTSKAYLLGTTSALSATAANVETIGDSYVYLTNTAGGFSAVKYYYNIDGTDKAYMTYNNTDNSIDFIFA